MHLHPDTRIAALAGGGLICVSPAGVRVFGQNGEPLLGLEQAPRGENREFETSRVAKGSWWAKSPAALTSIATKEWRRSPNTWGEGAQGEAHRI